MTPSTPAEPTPTWSSPLEGVRLVLRGVTFRTSARVALVVGAVLTAVNQGSIIVGGDATWMTWVRVGVNFLVPFVVSSIGYLAPLRRHADAADRLGGGIPGP